MARTDYLGNERSAPDRLSLNAPGTSQNPRENIPDAMIRTKVAKETVVARQEAIKAVEAAQFELGYN